MNTPVGPQEVPDPPNAPRRPNEVREALPHTSAAYAALAEALRNSTNIPSNYAFAADYGGFANDDNLPFFTISAIMSTTSLPEA